MWAKRSDLILTLGIPLVWVGLVLTLTAPQPGYAEGPIYVDADATTGAATGLSWTDAFTNVQDALADAVSGDEIWVAEGVYYPDEGDGQTDDDRASTFDLVSGAALYGGFDPDTGADAFAERDGDAHLTVLSGDLDQNDIVDDDGVITDAANITGTNAYNVVTAREVSSTTTFDGFIVTGGYADGSNCPSSPSYCGGGMLNYSELGDSTPTVRHVVFSGNYAEMDGGGMLNWNGDSAILIEVTFVGNHSDADGGGLMAHLGSDVRLTDVVFERNSASGGGGMAAGGSNPVLTNTIFIGNSATYWGGGFHNGPSLIGLTGSPRLTNVLFRDNVAGLGGGGMYNWGVSTPTLTNVTFSSNIGNIDNGIWPHMGGGGLYNYDGSTPILVNSILWGNVATGGRGHQILNTNSSTPTLSYSLIQSGTNDIYNNGVGNDVIFGPDILTDDPLFVDPSTGDYRLSYHSPAIDAGNNLSVTSSTDLAGNPRRIDVPTTPDTGSGDAPVVDMGANEAAGPIPDLRKSLSSTGLVPYYSTITYTLVLENIGVLSETAVLVTDTLPSGVTFADWIVQPAGAMRSGNAITWTETISAGDCITLTFTADQTGDAGEVITNTAWFSSTARRGSDDAVFTVRANQPPTADAGTEQVVRQGELVQLDGSASSDPDGHTPLTYRWTQTGGPAVSFTPNLSMTTFTAPTSTSVLTFSLAVTDTGALSDTDEVVITVDEYHVYLPLAWRSN